MVINAGALGISFAIVISVVLFSYGLKMLTTRSIEISRFKPNYEKVETPSKFKKPKKKSPLSTSMSAIIIIAGGLSAGVLVYAITGLFYLSAISFLIGFALPNIWYKWYLKNQESLMSKQLEKAAEIMAAVLKTENNIVGAIERAAVDADEPLKSNLIKTSQEIRLGVPINVAFESLAKNINVPEMLIISIGIELQQTGMAINMASMLEQAEKNIRNRHALKDQLKAITSENKMAGFIVSVIPFAVLTFMRIVNPEFVAPLFTTSVGLAVFFLCVAAILLGIYWLMQIADMKEY